MAAKVISVGCFFVVCWVASTGYPFHASCRLTWTFSNESCGTVYDKIYSQMKKWDLSTLAACKREHTQNCGYNITAHIEYTEINGTHTTPIHKYVDDITMKFYNSTSSCNCTVEGYSTSQVFYAVLDDGTNYCNLHNLVAGGELSDERYGFKEITGNRKCTQYSSAKCKKY